MANKARTHLTWSTEVERGRCPTCEGCTILIVSDAEWKADEESVNVAIGEEAYHDSLCDGVNLSEEISGHYCVTCDKLTSLSLNT